MNFARTGVFVNAGYVFARGGIALTGGQDVKRSALLLDGDRIIERLTAAADAYGGPGSLLRIYWYDAALARGLNTEHIRLAETENVKVRLGIVNDYGQQKGVDSLVIADLIELARNGAMTHAILLSGDDDLRVGVQVIQAFGVRVQLLGIETPRGPSQAAGLRREADKVTLWDESAVRTFLSLRPLPEDRPFPAAAALPVEPAVTPDLEPALSTASRRQEPVAEPDTLPTTEPDTLPVAEPDTATVAETDTSRVAAQAENVAVDGIPGDRAGGAELPPALVTTAQHFAASLAELDARTIAGVYLETGKVPYQFDARLLATVRTALQRELNQSEKREMRNVFIRALSDRLAARGEEPDAGG